MTPIVSAIETARRVLRRFSRRWTDYSRAALMVMACQAVGGDARSVRSAAKGLVLAGGAFDLHDDIIDRSFVRTEKGKESIQGIYGMEATLLAGDALPREELPAWADFAAAAQGLRFDQAKLRLAGFGLLGVVPRAPGAGPTTATSTST